MPHAAEGPGSNQALPLILVRGFGGMDVEGERSIAYQGFNTGTVYPHKRGENYIYEGLILRLMKSDWKYVDATNVVGYYESGVSEDPSVPERLGDFDREFFRGRVVIDPAMALALLERYEEPRRSIWVFRYYDLGTRNLEEYGAALVRLIAFIRELASRRGEETSKVNIIAHSMGGLIVREAIQVTYPGAGLRAADQINKVVTLGTPHQGISFQVLGSWLPSAIEAREELKRFSPTFQEDGANPSSFKNLHQHFPLQRFLTVVGTNYRSYGVKPASWLNRLAAVGEEYGANYNRSDGLVKQAFAQVPGAPRTFVHKCHGGFDSLVTSREAFEIATRFFFGDKRVRLRFVEGRVLRGRDWIGKSEFFLGVSIKPRGVDFSLFHQSAEAENCYGPFRKEDLSDEAPAFDWADGRNLIWEGWLDTSRILGDPSVDAGVDAGVDGVVEADVDSGAPLSDLVFRLDFYVGERDLFGIGFSDNVVFRKQYYARATLGRELELYCHTGEQFMGGDFRNRSEDRMRRVDGGWEFEVKGTGFRGTFRIEIEDSAGSP